MLEGSSSAAPLSAGTNATLNATLHQMYQFASISYCSNASLAAYDCIPCERSNSTVGDLRVFFNASTDARAATAVVSPQRGPRFIVLTWRGTETLENWIQNLCASGGEQTRARASLLAAATFFFAWVLSSLSLTHTHSPPCANRLAPPQQIVQDRSGHVLRRVQGARRIL